MLLNIFFKIKINMEEKNSNTHLFFNADVIEGLCFFKIYKRIKMNLKNKYCYVLFLKIFQAL